MASLNRCGDCGSFAVTSNCPNCGGRKIGATKLGVLATLFGSTAFAMTLMACYGCPNCSNDYEDGGPDAAKDARSSSSSSGSTDDDDDVSPPKDAGKDASDGGEDAGPKDAEADG